MILLCRTSPLTPLQAKAVVALKPCLGGRDHSYIDWEDHFINVVTIFEMPIKLWTRLATTFLHDDAMSTWKQ